MQAGLFTVKVTQGTKTLGFLSIQQRPSRSMLRGVFECGSFLEHVCELLDPKVVDLGSVSRGSASASAASASGRF